MSSKKINNYAREKSKKMFFFPSLSCLQVFSYLHALNLREKRVYVLCFYNLLICLAGSRKMGREKIAMLFIYALYTQRRKKYRRTAESYEARD